MRVEDLTLDYVGSWVKVNPWRFWKPTVEGKLTGVWREGDRWFVSVYNARTERTHEVRPRDVVDSSFNGDQWDM